MSTEISEVEDLLGGVERRHGSLRRLRNAVDDFGKYRLELIKAIEDCRALGLDAAVTVAESILAEVE